MFKLDNVPRGTILRYMKVKTDFGIQEIKPKRVFEFNGYKFAIVERPEKYMNEKDPLIMTRVVEYSTSIQIPVKIQHRETLKSIVNTTERTIEDFVKRGANLREEIQKFEIINP